MPDIATELGYGPPRSPTSMRSSAARGPPDRDSPGLLTVRLSFGYWLAVAVSGSSRATSGASADCASGGLPTGRTQLAHKINAFKEPDLSAVSHGGDPVRPTGPGIPGSEPGPAGVPSSARRLTTGNALRAVFLLLVLASGAYWVWKNRHGVADAWSRVTLLPVLGALAAAACGAWSGVPAWRTLLSGLGSELPLRAAQRVFLMGQLGKYIPGGVWTVLAQATMAKEYRVPRARSGTASLLTVLLAVVTSSVLGAICLAIAGRQVLGRYWWILLLVIPLLAVLHPSVLVWVGHIASRITRRNLRMERIPERTLLLAAVWLVGGQIFSGLSFYLLVNSIGGTVSNPLLSIGLFSMASAAGIVVIFLPAGVGAREIILVFGLSAVSGPGSAALVVLMSRVVLTVVDVVVAGSAAGLDPKRRLAVSASR